MRREQVKAQQQYEDKAILKNQIISVTRKRVFIFLGLLVIALIASMLYVFRCQLFYNFFYKMTVIDKGWVSYTSTGDTDVYNPLVYDEAELTKVFTAPDNARFCSNGFCTPSEVEVESFSYEDNVITMTLKETDFEKVKPLTKKAVKLLRCKNKDEIFAQAVSNEMLLVRNQCLYNAQTGVYCRIPTAPCPDPPCDIYGDYFCANGKCVMKKIQLYFFATNPNTTVKVEKLDHVPGGFFAVTSFGDVKVEQVLQESRECDNTVPECV